MISYNLSDSGILVVKLSGEVDSEAITNYLKEFETLDTLPKNLLTFYDLRDAEMKLNFKEIMSISKLSKKVTKSYTSVRTAFLVNKPNLTAYSVLFTNDAARGKTVRKVFSTEGAALAWLTI